MMNAGPTACARAGDDLERQAHAVFPAAAPAILPMIGPRGQELVDEVTLGSHDFDAVITRFLREPRATQEVGDLPMDAGLGQFARRESRDRRLQSRRRDGERVIGIAPGVENLHADPAALPVHGAGNQPMTRQVPPSAQRAGKGLGPARGVRRDSTCDDEPDAAARAFGKIRRQFRIIAPPVLESGMHRAHQHAVGERRETEIERRQQVREWTLRHVRNHIASTTS